MDFIYQALGKSYTLSFISSDKSLRPRDAADEYLLQEDVLNAAAAVLTVNDRAGALSVPLGEKLCALVNDSFTDARRVRGNLEMNGVSPPPVLNSLAALPRRPDLILMKIPKSLDSFRFQLRRLKANLPAGDGEGIPILAAGMNRGLPVRFFECFAAETEEAAYSRIFKKARIYRGRLSGSAPASQQHGENLKTEAGRDAAGSALPEPDGFSYSGRRYSSYPGVFARGRLDAGSRLLLDWLCREGPVRLGSPRLIADPGCGCGVLGLTALDLWPEARLMAGDDQALAVLSCRFNADEQDKSGRCDIRQTHILEGFPEASADLVLCNPPFHQGRSVSLETGFAFIRQAAAALKPRGTFLMVANSSLGYVNVLKECFSEISVLEKNKKYSLNLCRK